MTACIAIVRRTFFELDTFEESNADAAWGRRRADTDSMVDYSQCIEEFHESCCGCDASSLRATTVGESSSVDGDELSSRGSRWGDDIDESDLESLEQGNSAPAGPPGCHLSSGPPGCHLSAPVFFAPAAPRSFQGQPSTRPARREVTQTSTLVLRQLPEQYVRSHVRKLLNEKGFSGQFDFIYTPADFKTSKTLRYAIVNFSSIAIAKKAKEQLDGAAVDDAVLEVQFSKTHAGIESLVEKYRHSPVMTDRAVPASQRPLLLSNGKAVAFPWPRV
jgi:hypothetical protein